MDDFNNNPDPILEPREIGLILLATLFVFILFIFFVGFLGERVSLLFGEVIMIVPALAYIFYRRLPVIRTFRLQPIHVSKVAATVILFVPVFILTDELDRFIQMIFPMPDEWVESITELVQFNSWQDAVVILFAGVVVAALAEEMLFRGIVQRSLEHFREPAIAIVLTSVLFALVHFNPWTSIQITVLGLVLGYVAWKSGSIFPAILIHGLNNFISLLMMNSTGSLAWYAKTEHVNIIWIVLAVALVIPAFHFFNKTCE